MYVSLWKDLQGSWADSQGLVQENMEQLETALNTWAPNVTTSRTLSVGTSVPFRALDYSASIGMTWVVPGAAQQVRRAVRVGTLLFYTVILTGSTVGGTPGVALRVALPLGMSAAFSTVFGTRYQDAGGAITPGFGTATANLAYLECFTQTGAVWTAGSGTTLAFQAVIEVSG